MLIQEDNNILLLLCCVLTCKDKLIRTNRLATNLFYVYTKHADLLGSVRLGEVVVHSSHIGTM